MDETLEKLDFDKGEFPDSRSLEQTLGWTLGVIFLVLSLFPVFDPHLRTQLHDFFLPSQRVVLTTASTALPGTDQIITVVKIRTTQNLLLEIYKSSQTTHDQKLIDKITLPDRRDGYFHYNGQATNLVLDDINNNHKLDIITSTYDEDLIAHLLVFEYNETSGTFEPLVK